MGNIENRELKCPVCNANLANETRNRASEPEELKIEFNDKVKIKEFVFESSSTDWHGGYLLFECQECKYEGKLSYNPYSAIKIK